MSSTVEGRGLDYSVYSLIIEYDCPTGTLIPGTPQDSLKIVTWLQHCIALA